MTKTTRQKKTLRVLEEGLSRIERGWTQHTAARDVQNKPVDPSEPSAVCWCMLGAIACGPCVPDYVAAGARTELVDTIRLQGYPNAALVSEYNDGESRTKDDVIAVYKRTIDRLRAGLQVPSRP